VFLNPDVIEALIVWIQNQIGKKRKLGLSEPGGDSDGR